ncbi:hypothetical protein N0V90_003537 [Kalmusia sp. IMI 367209]|nr:hypothetical protein N0V90_003537 [Kalmusia sp. IMI 367209]
MDVINSKANTRVPQPQDAPLLTLPLELIQQVTSYLDPDTAASFCLSSRYIYYAVGTEHLNSYLSVHNAFERYSKIERRKRIEILERAFPSHWYCAWCDKFHTHDLAGGPRAFSTETQRDCAEFNSYLHDGHDYVLCYHHIRLAFNRYLWGPSYGLPLSAFTHEAHTERKIGKTTANTHLQCEARIANNSFLLHATYTLHLPPDFAVPSRTKKTMEVLMSAVPHIVVGHRASRRPHTGLQERLENYLSGNVEHKGVRLCQVCETDFIVAFEGDDKHPQQTRSIRIEVWRYLGTGRNPFDTVWREHGELGAGKENTKVRAWERHQCSGLIKKAFEESDGVAEGGTSRKGWISEVMEEKKRQNNLDAHAELDHDVYQKLLEKIETHPLGS